MVMTPVRVLIVDDHPAFAQGLRVLLSADPHMSPIATVTEPRNAVEVIAEWLPDVVVMSLELADVNGIALITELVALPAPPLVVTFTTHTDAPATARAMEAGAVGFLTKDLPLEDVSAAIKAAAQGGTWIPARLLIAVMKFFRAGPAPESDDAGVGMIGKLTGREQEVLRLMVSGLDRAAISARLYLSRNTVRTHIGAIMTKLGVHSTVEAVAMALRAGMRPESADFGQADQRVTTLYR